MFVSLVINVELHVTMYVCKISIMLINDEIELEIDYILTATNSKLNLFK